MLRNVPLSRRKDLKFHGNVEAEVLFERKGKPVPSGARIIAK
jgi:hypothetical protein